MLGFSPISSNALGEIPSQQTSTTLSAALVSLSSLQASLLTIPSNNLSTSLQSQSTVSATLFSSEPVLLYAALASSGTVSGSLTTGVSLYANLVSVSSITATFAGTGSIGIGDRVDIRRLPKIYTIRLT